MLTVHPHIFIFFPPSLSFASVMTSTKGEMMESIFIGMISIKYQLTWSLSHACKASRVNVHLISQRSARLEGNDPEGPLARGPGRCTPPPYGHPTALAYTPGTLRWASAPCEGLCPCREAQPGSAGRRRPGQRARGYRAGSARPPRPCAPGLSAAPSERTPEGGAGVPRPGWIRAGLGRVFFLPEERHM